MKAAAHRAHALYSRETDDDSALIRRHSPLIEMLARQISSRTGSPQIYDDLWSVGALGLIDAKGRFEEGRGTRFETFAEHRIRGAMLDELRRMDHLPRRLRSETNKVPAARKALSQKLGRPPDEEEIATELGMSVGEVHELEALTQPLLSIDDARLGASDDPSPQERASKSQLLAQIAAHIAELPERQRIVLSLHYVESLTYREIAAVLGVSEPRICQIHGAAVAHLRAALVEPE